MFKKSCDRLCTAQSLPFFLPFFLSFFLSFFLPIFYHVSLRKLPIFFIFVGRIKVIGLLDFILFAARLKEQAQHDQFSSLLSELRMRRPSLRKVP